MVLLFLLLFQESDHRSFDLSNNVKIAEIIMNNPDTLSLMIKDTTIWYKSSPMLKLNENQKRKLIDNINDNFNNFYTDENIIIPGFIEENGKQNFFWYSNIISYKNKKNDLVLHFVFDEVSNNEWKLNMISFYNPKDWPEKYQRK